MDIRSIYKEVTTRFRLALEPYFFAALTFRILAGRGDYSQGMRYSISALVDYSKKCYAEGSDFSFISTSESIQNVSGGLSRILVDLAIRHEPPNTREWLLIGEAPQTGVKLATYMESNFGLVRQINELETLLGKRWSGSEFELDLCHAGVTEDLKQTFAVVITQALLEHVFDPVQVLRNLIPLLHNSQEKDSKGILVVHTNNPLMPLHRWPVDTLRYYDDWFNLVSQYLPLNLIEIKAQGHNMFAVYRMK